MSTISAAVGRILTTTKKSEGKARGRKREKKKEERKRGGEEHAKGKLKTKNKKN